MARAINGCGPILPHSQSLVSGSKANYLMGWSSIQVRLMNSLAVRLYVCCTARWISNLKHFRSLGISRALRSTIRLISLLQELQNLNMFLHKKSKIRPLLLRSLRAAILTAAGNFPIMPCFVKKSASLYACYLKQIAHLSRFYLIGRLAEHQYYNMDAIVGQALSRSKKILQDLEGSV